MKKNLTVLAGIIGNTLEWYDFTIYAFFAPVLATLFFPAKDSFLSLLMTFSVFAAGFLVRPLGGVLFGYIGDHYGRRLTLIISIIVMSLPTVLLALLPSYQSLGVVAPILFIVLRLLQGTAVSGELTTTTSFLVEHAAPQRRGYAGSLAMCSAMIGITLSSGVAAFLTYFLTHDQLISWGWRSAFAAGGVIGFIGLFLRLSAAETQMYQQAKKENAHLPPSFVHHFLNLNWRAVGMATLLTAVMSVGNYFLFAYFNTFLVKEIGLSPKEVTLSNFISLVVFTLLVPLMGKLSDKIGRKRVLGTGMVGIILMTYPIFWMMAQKNIACAFLAELLFVFTLAPISGLIPTVLAELFETRTRNTGLSIGYNLSMAIFGGTAPLVALVLVNYTKSVYSPGVYLIGIALISLVMLFSIKETYQHQLR